MNILIHSHLFPNSAKPLIGNFVFNFSQALSLLGHKVTVVSPIPYVPKAIPKKHPWFGYKFVLPYYQMAGLNIYHPRFLSIPRRILFFFRGELMYFSAIHFYNRLLKSETFDIIHCHVALPDGVVGSYLSNRFKIPYGVTIHGADIYESISENNLNYRKIKKVIEKAAFVGIVSQKLYDLILQGTIIPPKKTTRVVYNGYNYPETKFKLKLTNIKKDSIKLLSVGHMIQRKGIEIVLRALKILQNKFNNIELFIIGDGPDYFRLKKLAKELNVLSITHFLGAKNNTEVLNYMKACDIFVLPSWNESFGIVYIEAMSMGMITVGSKNEGISEVIEDGKNGFLVKPKNVEDLKNKLAHIITNYSDMTSIKNAAIDSVKSVYSWEKNAQEYINLYKYTLKEKQH